MKDNSRINASINSDTYLYGFSLKPLSTQPYIDVLVIKLSLAKKLVETLIRSDSEDKTRISSIYKAQEFNRELIKELGYSDTDIRNMIKKGLNPSPFITPSVESIIRIKNLYK